MSLRQYRPRSRGRRGMTSRQSRILYSLLTATIFLQILYPLIHGGTLRVITILIVYLAALTMLTHALFSFGMKYFSIYLLVTFTFALAIEEIGIRTGWPFGSYHYSHTLGFQILSVPFVVPFAWIMMAHPILLISRKISTSWTFLIGGLGLMIWDLFVDPQMVAAGRWMWKAGGPRVPFEPTIPLSNAAGWFLGGMGLIAILHKLLPKERRKVGASALVVELFLLWTLFSGIVGNVFFFDTPGVALIAGLPFLILLIPYFFNTRLGRPDIV